LDTSGLDEDADETIRAAASAGTVSLPNCHLPRFVRFVPTSLNETIIATGARIGDGVTLGAGSIVGAWSVVHHGSSGRAAAD
jgi:hypothetical protein